MNVTWAFTWCIIISASNLSVFIYPVCRGSKHLLLWESFRRLYFFAMTENMKAILRHWQKELFTDEVKRAKGINERAVWASATMIELDEEYTRYGSRWPPIFLTVEVIFGDAFYFRQETSRISDG